MGQAMSKQDDDDQFDQGDDDPADDDDNSQDSGSDNSAPPASGSDESGGKRVNDLMSKWQSEQARANKAEAELKALKEGGSPEATKRRGVKSEDKAASEFMEFARENARITLFNSEPKFAEFGLTPEAIAGSTVEDMKASAKAQLELLKTIETKARAAALQEHGLEPEAEGGQAEGKLPSFATMSDKEFADFLGERGGSRI